MKQNANVNIVVVSFIACFGMALQGLSSLNNEGAWFWYLMCIYYYCYYVFFAWPKYVILKLLKPSVVDKVEGGWIDEIHKRHVDFIQMFVNGGPMKLAFTWGCLLLLLLALDPWKCRPSCMKLKRMEWPICWVNWQERFVWVVAFLG